MEKLVFITLYLDTRRTKANGRHPVKLRVFTPEPRKQKLYPTIYDFTEKEFQNVWLTTKPTKENREIKEKLQALEKMAIEKAENLVPFTFEEFDQALKTVKGDRQNVFFKYKEHIERLKSLDQIGTAQLYDLSFKSLTVFAKELSGKEVEKLFYREITPLWLEKYEKYMIETNKRSTTTVSMYLRCLRAIFNNAIADKDIDYELFPFGKRKYQIPNFKKVKKALDKHQLKTLFDSNPKNPEQERAKDFWFLSFFCNGINLKDIAILRWENLEGDKLTFIRAKTKTTAKTNQKYITVYLNEFSKSILKKYSNPMENPKSLIFPIILDQDSEILKFKKIKNFTRFVNQNLKILAKNNGITDEISSYWARHSFATNLIRSGKSMEIIGEAFGHSDKKTTQNYFAGFDNETKKEISNDLMNFLEL
ncbi:MAG: site-specific integrase [Saprospiraceae bacterium]